jgi:hypothetical protein
MATVPPKRRAAQATDKAVKRTRVSRACDQCRIAREKCNGTQPTCSTCSTSGRACTYTANVKKRGIQPGYIRALELALAYLFQHNPENEILVNDKLGQGGTSSLLLSRESKESNKLHKRWRKTRFFTDVDKLLSGGEPSRHEQSEPLSPDSDEEQSDMEEPPLMVASNTPALRQSHIPNAMPPPLDGWLQTSLVPSADPGTPMSMPLDSWRLIEVYFTYTQSWLPISDKNTVLKTSYSYPVEGLLLDANLHDAGDHAELWSILAVASSTSAPQHNLSRMTTAQLYDTSRSLIPRELGYFELGHVKALLNLAVVDVGRSCPEAAWLLIGYASRILEVMDQSLLLSDQRHKHVFCSCFLLDSILAMHFDRRPYFQVDDIRQHGKIDEDGLDEWQPWSGGSDASLGHQRRAPTLALSSFNYMLHIFSISNDIHISTQEKLENLKTLETSLPSKLAFICTVVPTGPLTPSAVLLQTIHHCVSFALISSDVWLSRLLDLLERAQDLIGWRKLPPVLCCLLEFVHRRSGETLLSRNAKDRLARLRTGLSTTWPRSGFDHTPKSRTTQPTSMVPTTTFPSKEHNLYQTAFSSDSLAAPTSSDSALSSLFPTVISAHHVGLVPGAPRPIQPDSLYPQVPSDLESFFDELASLDTANNLENQPQFMQNLGFAPDANMADLFSEYIPISTAFMENDEPVNLDHCGF